MVVVQTTLMTQTGNTLLSIVIDTRGSLITESSELLCIVLINQEHLCLLSSTCKDISLH